MKLLPVRAIVGFLLLFVGLSVVSGQMMQTYAQFAYSHMTGSRQLESSQRYFGNSYVTCFPGEGNIVQCSGDLYQDPNGCVLLVVPALTWVNDPGNVVTAGLQYYTLHDLPKSYPPLGVWVTVTGQLYRGYNTAPNGEACPGNYINVTSIA
jgi:hypothetical protein